jgi:ABC-type Mn2+/Zn2+ transport system permease subunit
LSDRGFLSCKPISESFFAILHSILCIYVQQSNYAIGHVDQVLLKEIAFLPLTTHLIIGFGILKETGMLLATLTLAVILLFSEKLKITSFDVAGAVWIDSSIAPGLT